MLVLECFGSTVRVAKMTGCMQCSEKRDCLEFDTSAGTGTTLRLCANCVTRLLSALGRAAPSFRDEARKP